MNGLCSYYFVIYYGVKVFINRNDYYPFLFKEVSKLDLKRKRIIDEYLYRLTWAHLKPSIYNTYKKNTYADYNLIFCTITTTTKP